jgi:hypothetical protein
LSPMLETMSDSVSLCLELPPWDETLGR